MAKDIEEDFYKILEIDDVTISKEQIAKQFKKMSLKFHPDKNRNDPNAADKFHQIYKAYEVLTDDKARSAYDVVIRAKLARKKRDNEMDSKRRKMKEELEQRENKVKKQKVDEESAKANLKHEIERIRRERMEILQKQALSKASQAASDVAANATLKVAWDHNKGEYTQEKLRGIFSMFGEIDFIVVSSNNKKKRGGALVAFKNANSAYQAAKQPLGNVDNRLEINFVGPTPSFTETANSDPEKPAPAPATELPKAPAMSFKDHLQFEEEILKKMMAASKQQ